MMGNDRRLIPLTFGGSYVRQNVVELEIPIE